VLRDYIDNIFSACEELHGDRLFTNDHAIIGGFVTFQKESVMVIGKQKG
jgi:acetyl-CoA carboxylase carboxyl transferase subunit alpha